VNSREVLEIFCRYRDGAAVMVSSGRSGAILWELGQHDGVAYMSGMACTGPASFGLALARPDVKVVAVVGDGAALMALAHLVTIGRYQPKNLVVLVINNRVYRSTDRGELATATAECADIAGLGRAAGIERSVAVDTPDQAERYLREAMAEEGPSLIVANVDATLVMDPERGGELPDRTELAIGFQRYLRELRPPPGESVRPSTESAASAVAQSEGPGRAAAREIYDALKAVGIDYFVYLPETILYPVQELAERDPGMLTICCTREDEGVAIAGGATAAGRWPVVAMEGTGVGLSGLALAHMIDRRAPILLLTSHSQILGIRAAHDNLACMVNEPILRALNIHTAVLTHLRDTRVVLRETMQAAKVLKQPVAVVVPPYVMHEAG
jgi:thiamine pyrophosphate-dependent acetolactate synthase large subunit-like protein